MGEDEHRVVALGAEGEIDRRAFPPARGVGGERPPKDAARRLERVDSYSGDALALIEAKHARAADRGLELGVTRPPAANALRRGERLVNPLGRGVDPDEMHDVGHGAGPFLPHPINPRQPCAAAYAANSARRAGQPPPIFSAWPPPPGPKGYALRS